jgi:hypothetical protein
MAVPIVLGVRAAAVALGAVVARFAVAAGRSVWTGAATLVATLGAVLRGAALGAVAVAVAALDPAALGAAAALGGAARGLVVTAV